MKRNLFLTLSVFILFSTNVITAQKKMNQFAEQWKKIEQYADKQLPESALKEVNIILDEAQKTNNFAQTVKAYIYKMRFTMDKNPDEAPSLIKEFENFTKNYNNPVDAALLHSMTAELHAMYYRGQQYTINQRTAIEGFTPENINEWSKNIFFDKIANELKLSLEAKPVLQKSDTSQFEALIEKGKDSADFQPTLFDFLGQRAVSILQSVNEIALIKNPLNANTYFSPVKEFVQVQPETQYNDSKENLIIQIYQQLLSFRLSEDNVPALLFIDLQRLDFVHNNSQNIDVDELYIAALENLNQVYASNQAVVLAFEKTADYYIYRQYDYLTENNDYNKRAYDICQKGIEKYPNYKYINNLKNIQAGITQKNIDINYPTVGKPGNKLKIKVNSRNISNLQLDIYRIDATANEYYVFYQNNQSYNRKPYPNRKLIETKNLTFEKNENFTTDENEITITAPAYGIYEFTVKEKGSTKRTEQAHGAFTVSDFAFIQRKTDKSNTEAYILDRVSGKPVPGVNVDITYSKWEGNKYSLNEHSQAKTNESGLFNVSNDRSYYIYFFSKGEDKYFSSEANNYYYPSYSGKIEDKTQLSLFTDRSIYRPGQTVYFKGIAYLTQKQEVVTNQNFIVELLDANNQKVSSVELTTNELGSFASQFALPQSGLNGAYQLKAGSFSTTIYVEEYKRPTFEVNIDKPETEVNFGENFTFEGNVKAYAGYAVPDAQVKYTITRRNHRLLWWNYTPEQIVASGMITSDSDGKFKIDFTPEKIRSKNSLLREQFYTYTLTTSVTDTKGETQQGAQSISVGDKSLFIVTEVPEMHNKQTELAIKVHTETLNGKELNSAINYTLYQLEKTDVYKEKLDDTTRLKESRQVRSGQFDTKDKNLKIDTKDLQSGYYKLVLTTKDAKGSEVKTENTFILYDANENRPPVKTYLYLLTPKTKVNTGESAQIRFGTSATDVHVLYQLMQGNKVLESKWLVLNNEIRNFDIELKKEYADGVNIMFTFVKDEEVFSRSVQIERKTEEKKLSPSFSVFRDKLKPGENATWTVHIPEAVNDKAIAELMVGMYDASLDVIRPHNWVFNPAYRLKNSSSRGWSANGFKDRYAGGYFEIKTAETHGIYLNQLNWFGLSMSQYYYGGGPIRIRGTARMKNNMEAPASPEAIVVEDRNMMIGESSDVVLEMEDDALLSLSVSNIEETGQVQIRTNFNETAFFYPQLRTDKDGNVKFSFTVPESLTRWNVKMLAHTADLYFGQAEAEAITQKDLMVQLNMPRFVRRSDKLVLVANVINLTENALTANVKLELLNPENEQVIKLKDNKAKNVTLSANETKAVEWEITEFSGYELVIAKVTAQAGKFSDGEQRYLPVLPDKVLVTESMPMTVRGNETRDFRFESLISQAKKVDSKNLTIEFASNPTWYAVQALPTLSSPENENAIDYFTAYYVNGLAGYIANANPKTSAMFDRWKQEGGSREALLSNLEKNAELKNMLLEETPWVMAAKDESEQKRQIALLFDLNQQKNQKEQYLNKLIKLQKPSGGFAWYDGMSESRYVTQQILLGMARYNKMTKAAEAAPDWIKKAVEYIDLEIARDFDSLKKNNKNYNTSMVISDMQWFYLHVRSEYKQIPLHNSAKEAVQFYTSQAEKYWTKATLYGKAATALISHRNGNSPLASDILKSLKENAMKTDEMGIYWAGNKAGYLWNERPVSVQVAISEAFSEITQDAKDVDEMKIWLLKQKQTQRWDSPISTVDAIYSLLNYGTDWLQSDSQVEIRINNKLLEPSSIEAGTGYIKETIPNNNITPRMGNITVKKTDAGIAWGAMYWQYYQDVDKVQQHGGALSVTQKLFVERTVDNKTTLLPIEQASVKKGDKVVIRLVVTTDRNLEFVALKDLRAACFEPVSQRSGMVWREGVSYYQTTKDTSTQFFFNFLPAGTYVFEYEVWANNTGEFADGMSTIQCQYAPEFTSHTRGSKIKIE
ncbi:hypothetical protein D0T49_03230 [Paludibacter sp. 221]|uniref:alpha-2-macroglobulin family protein n=1 Tax=Paludibacter sp. 221 TaxID=2302939 RepID=UPI0013CF8C1B|nr:alpha-2-macroglobulin family protein [Paludibacter sp. 221]NDV46053.1 hypothetical protein [Paludibacter sp. 221]